VSIPPLVTQIGDGENGGVMMNEFPPIYLGTYEDLSHEGVVPLNGTEYVELIEAAGARREDYIPIQPIHQHAVWLRMGCETTDTSVSQAHGLQSVGFEEAVAAAKREISNFHLDGGSWTNDLSWVRGYEGVLDPMNRLSAEFHQKLDNRRVNRSSPAYRQALLYLLLSQTSCFRYWGEGRWGDYARELCRRGRQKTGQVQFLDG